MGSIPWWGWLLVFVFVVMPLLYWGGMMGLMAAQGVQK